MIERVICSRDDCPNGNAFHKNSTILPLANGDLLAAWMANPPAGESARSHAQNVYGSRLPAGADEWTDPVLWVDVPGRAVSCPVLFCGPGDAIWLAVAQQYGNSIAAGRLF